MNNRINPSSSIQSRAIVKALVMICIIAAIDTRLTLRIKYWWNVSSQNVISDNTYLKSYVSYAGTIVPSFIGYPVKKGIQRQNDKEKGEEVCR